MTLTTSKGELYYDIDENGIIEMANPQTIEAYITILNTPLSKKPKDEYDIFFAFSNKQFEEGKQKLLARGVTEKLYQGPAGLFGTKKGITDLLESLKTKDEKIKEQCDPQEVYFWEYNNYESMLARDGDLGPMKIIFKIYGKKIAKKIKRYSAFHSLDYIKSI